MEINIKNIIEDYTDNNFGIDGICKKYHIGKLKVKKILGDNGIPLKKRGNQSLNKSYVIEDWKVKKYDYVPNHHYIAKYKSDGKVFNDYMNAGGFLTSYIREKENIEIPSLYDRREYYRLTGNYWWEQYFDIILVENVETKKCPYCDWETVDTENKSGAFEIHLKEAHNVDIEEYVKEFPQDIDYFKVYKRSVEKKNLFKDKKNYVICPICGKKMKKITLYHLIHKHGMSMTEFKEKYPTTELASEEIKKIDLEHYKLGNLTVSKHRFVSKYEREIQEFLTKNNIEFMPNRQILDGKEIDILIESKHLGIEFDGLKWHTEYFGKKNKHYHLDKTLTCNEHGYKLIHIFEDEYVNRKEIVYSKLKQLIGLNSNLPKVGGRKIHVQEIYSNDAKIFLDKYHIQGSSSSSVYLGGFYKDELIAVMSFKFGNIKNRDWELTRFATRDDIICQGVGGKLFKHFIRNYNPSRIVSFADRRWTLSKDDNLYTKLGFILESENLPDYKYYNDRVDKYKRFHKMSFNKKKLSKMYGFPLTMTEKEMTKELGFDRIWDCGLFKYVWKADYF